MNSDRKHFNFNDLEQWLDRHRVTEIECLVPDLTGVARGKILPRQKFTEDRGMRLPEAVVAMGVTGEFPSEGPYYDVISPTDHDMHLRPDPRTVRIVPWASDPTAQVGISLAGVDLSRGVLLGAMPDGPDRMNTPDTTERRGDLSGRFTGQCLCGGEAGCGC